MKYEKIKKVKATFEKMNMVYVSSAIQIQNNTFAFFDKEANCNFVFRENSDPRIEYFSTKTNSVQSYKLFKSLGEIHEDMENAIPYIVNRKVKGARERVRIAMDIAMKLMQPSK